MRRVLGTVLTLLVAAGAAPATAAPAKGEVVIVADGSAAGTVTVPAIVSLDLARARVATKSPHYVLVAYRSIDDGPSMFALRTPLSRMSFVQPGTAPTLPKGRSQVRVLAGSPVTFRIPAKGVRGRLTIRLTRRLGDAVAETADATVGPVAGRSHIGFDAPGDALVVHGYDTLKSASPARHEWLCVGAAGNELCDETTYFGDVYTGGSPNEAFTTALYEPSGARAAKLRVADAGVVGPVRHFVMVLPLA